MAGVRNVNAIRKEGRGFCRALLCIKYPVFAMPSAPVCPYFAAAPVASPERMRKIHDRALTAGNSAHAPVSRAMPHAMTSTTEVRTAVATSEFALFTPHLERIAVMPAKNAEPIAAAIHTAVYLVFLRSQRTRRKAAAIPMTNSAMPTPRSAPMPPPAQPRYTSMISGLKNIVTAEPSDSPATA